MQFQRHAVLLPAAALLMLAALACNFVSAPPSVQANTQPPPPQNPGGGATFSPEAATTTPSETATAQVTHVVLPADSVGSGKLIYDVVSEDTAPEKRAPYGDSYDINRLERPFLQDMTYIPDLDIMSFSVSSDATWWYVSIVLVGGDPNNQRGLDYGVELDTNYDGFGDYLVWAHSPYPSTWDSAPVQIFQDKNHDTGGLSAEKSDAPITTDGYETRIFNGGPGDADPDTAWVRAIPGVQGTVQLAFKKSWSGSIFMLGVIADAGLKDPKKLDYVDRFKIEEAGSPVRDNKNYPLKALFAVDNVCRAPFGFKATGYEPQLCPSTEPPATKKPHPTAEPTQPIPQCLPAGTLIDTPRGPLAVQNLRIGDTVWTSSRAGDRIAAAILKISRVPVPAGHLLVHVRLDDGREVWASPGHPTADGRFFRELRTGDQLDGTIIAFTEVVPSDEPATYDLLPSGETGFYWADGILIGSTLGP